MDKETLDGLIDECIEALQEASRILRQNLKQIQDGSLDLQKKEEKLKEWSSRHLELNRSLLIDFYDIVPSDLMDGLVTAVPPLYDFKDEFVQYRNFIEAEFKKVAPRKRAEIDNLLE